MWVYYSGQLYRQGCKKKSEKKDFIEWYIVEQTVKYVLTAERRHYIAEKIVAQYNSNFSAEQVAELERRLVSIDIEINNCAEALINARSAAVIDKINNKADSLQLQNEDTEIELAKLKIACDISLTVEEVELWLQSFCCGDLMDLDFRKKIIDVFINSIYLYDDDDKVVIYYNVKDSRQISYMEMLADLEQLDDSLKCSDSSVQGEPEESSF